MRARHGLPPRPERKPRTRPAPPPEADSAQQVETPSTPLRPEPAIADTPLGPDLAASFEEFRALVGRAFLAPSPEPEEESMRVLDELVGNLWHHLQMFEVSLQEETERLEEAMNDMAEAMPTTPEEMRRRRCRIEAILKVQPEHEQVWIESNDKIRQCLGAVMRQRYDPNPEIDRFCGG